MAGRLHSFFRVLILVPAWVVAAPCAEVAEELDTYHGLQRFEHCDLLLTDWADGDSFRVGLEGGLEITVRLYGVDCMEWHISDSSDARRLRAQRRYFGISNASGNSSGSITLAKQFGRRAAERVREILAEPFTVYTAGADAGGSGRYKRVYGFVHTTAGRDLSAQLVEEGLARAYGVTRQGPDGTHRDETRARLADLELTAAKLGRGIWAETDWSMLPDERRINREEEAELTEALDSAVQGGQDLQVDPNRASRDALMRLPGIGEAMADAIIEGRTDGPYAKPEDLDRINGIGVKTVERIRGFLIFAP